MEWNAKTDPPPSGPKLKQILDANTELDGPREARTQLKEKVDKIREPPKAMRSCCAPTRWCASWQGGARQTGQPTKKSNTRER